MLKSLNKNTTLLDILIAVFILIIAGFIYAQGDLTTYMATPMAIANPEIFKLDFSIQEFLRPNAQSISDYVMAFFLRIGFSWQALSVFGYIVTAGVFAAGIIAISRHLCKANSWIMSGSIILLSLFALSGLRIGRNPIWYYSFYYAQIGFCIAVWAFYFALKKRWYLSFILLTIATMFHFTVGCWSASFVVIFLITDCIKTKRYKNLLAILPWVVVCVMIYLMMYLGGSTNTGLLSNDMFIKIHCYLRHPHHHILSSWENLEWVNFACYIISVFAILYASTRMMARDENYLKLRNIFFVSTALTVSILMFNYIFVEIIPLSFVGKLQPARSVFIYRFFLAGILAYCIYILWENKQCIWAAMIVAFVCIPQIEIKTYSGFFMLFLGIAMVIYFAAKKKELHIIKHLSVLLAVILAIAYILLPGNNISILFIYFKIFAFIILCYLITMLIKLPLKNRGKAVMKIVIIVAAMIMLIVPMIDIQGQFERIRIKSFKSMYSPLDRDNDINMLADRVKDSSDADILFFGNPYDIQTSYFRMFSERSSVIAYKNMPFTDKGMLEWVERLKNMGGLSMGSDGYYIKNRTAFGDMSPQEKMDYCVKYNATHLLVRLSEDKVMEYEKIGFIVSDNENYWYILEIS